MAKPSISSMIRPGGTFKLRFNHSPNTSSVGKVFVPGCFASLHPSSTLLRRSRSRACHSRPLDSAV
eukprot:5870273-Lingulodinium_polyedra.AAC.1